MQQLAPMNADILTRIFRALHEHGGRYVVFGGIAVNAREVAEADRERHAREASPFP